MRRCILALTAAAVMVFGRAAMADPYGFVNLELTSAGPDSVTAYYPGAPGGGIGGVQLGPYGYTLSQPTPSLLAAPSGYSYTGASSLVGLGSTNQLGFCISLTNEIQLNTPTPYSDFYVMKLSDAVGAASATNIESLLYLYTTSGGTLPPVLGSNKYQDALTLGIWDVLTENPLASNDSVLKGSPNQGNVYFSNPSSSNATAALGTGNGTNIGSGNSEGITDMWLSELSTVSNTQRQMLMNSTELLGLVDVKNGSVQAQSIYISGLGAPPPVPEPGRIVGLAGMGLVGIPLGFLALRRKRLSAKLRQAM
jgi:hypothetical protein